MAKVTIEVDTKDIASVRHAYLMLKAILDFHLFLKPKEPIVSTEPGDDFAIIEEAV